MSTWHPWFNEPARLPSWEGSIPHTWVLATKPKLCSTLIFFLKSCRAGSEIGGQARTKHNTLTSTINLNVHYKLREGMVWKIIQKIDFILISNFKEVGNQIMYKLVGTDWFIPLSGVNSLLLPISQLREKSLFIPSYRVG
jgi:hypothetical protein